MQAYLQAFGLPDPMSSVFCLLQVRWVPAQLSKHTNAGSSESDAHLQETSLP